MDIQIIKLPKERWEEYKALRLEALRNDPTAFGSSYEEEEIISDQEWQERLQKRMMWFAEVKGKLVGMVGFNRRHNLKLKHGGSIVAVYVSPQARGQGIASNLLEKVLEEITSDSTIVKLDLNVNTQNESAIKLYQKFGFKIVGTLEKEMFIDGQYFDEYEMEKIIK